MFCHLNWTWTALMGSSWMYQLAVPSTLPLHQGHHHILFDFRNFLLWQRGKHPPARTATHALPFKLDEERPHGVLLDVSTRRPLNSTIASRTSSYSL